MQGKGEQQAEIDNRNRIWFFPNKFWAATQGMSSDEADRLMAEVERYAAAKNLEALRNYPFVFIGDPYKRGSSAA